MHTVIISDISYGCINYSAIKIPFKKSIVCTYTPAELSKQFSYRTGWVTGEWGAVDFFELVITTASQPSMKCVGNSLIIYSELCPCYRSERLTVFQTRVDKHSIGR